MYQSDPGDLRVEVLENAIVVKRKDTLLQAAKIIGDDGFIALLKGWSARELYSAAQEFYVMGVFHLMESCDGENYVLASENLEPGDYPDFKGKVIVSYGTEQEAVEYISWLLLHDEQEDYEVYWLREWPGEIEDVLHADALEEEARELEQQASDERQILDAYTDVENGGLTINLEEIVDFGLANAVADGCAGYRMQAEYNRQVYLKDILRGGETRNRKLEGEARELRSKAKELREQCG